MITINFTTRDNRTNSGMNHIQKEFACVADAINYLRNKHNLATKYFHLMDDNCNIRMMHLDDF